MRQSVSLLFAILVLVPALAQLPAREGSPPPLMTVTGMIQAAGDQVLILRTDVGRYVTMSLPSRYTITRRTDVSLDSITMGDVVGVVWGQADDGTVEALQIHVYPEVTQEAALAFRAANTSAPGLELRAVVQRVDRDANEGVLRLAHADGEAALRARLTVPVAVVQAAAFAELRPFTGRARAIAHEEEDGSLVVRAIEILW